MKKAIKWILGLGTVGTAAGLLSVRLIRKSKNTSSDTPDDFTDNTGDETISDSFDLDQDLEPAPERSYVSLHVSSQPEDNTENAENSENTEVSEPENETVSEDTENE